MTNAKLRFAAMLAWLDRPSTVRRLAWALPLLCGLYALRLGQDANWDLLNYHRYNPFALLNGKLGLDLAPAQWQSYFNPTLDLLYYGLGHLLPAPLAGFLMGALHGLNMVLALAIARHLTAARAVALRVPVLLAVVAGLGPSFRLQIGNTMGDNSTAVLVLAAFYLLVTRAACMPMLLGAGLLAGLATGLKLTNAMYALALCLALFALDGPWLQRLRHAVLFGVAVLVGIAISGGWWYWTMWTTFANPLFPQFNTIFQAPLAAPVGIGDTGWLPKTWGERLLWPFIFTLEPARVIELKIRQLVWPALYLLYWGWLAALAVRRPAARLDQHARFTLLFIALAYLIWLNLFSIYRYLVVLELLAPLAIWLLLGRLLPPGRHGRVAAVVLGVCALAALSTRDWGHEKWARTSFRIETPVVAAPARSMVFMVTADPPLGWIVPAFPADLAFVSLGAGFPESEAYRQRVGAMVDARTTYYLMLPVAQHEAPGQRADYLRHAGEQLARYGLAPEALSCRRHTAWLGAKARQFDWCLATR